MSKKQLGIQESYDLLNSYGIAAQGRLASSKEEAIQVGEIIGYPLVIKAISDRIIHKSDIGAVHLNISNQTELQEAYDLLIKNIEQVGFRVKDLDGVLVQHMAKVGFELLVGAKQDPSFGPITMIGLGGKYVELYSDAATGIGKLNRDDILRMLSETKAGQILSGYRGEKLDLEAVVKLTIQVSTLMAAHPEILELDLNPVLVYEEGLALVDTRVIQGIPVVYPTSTELSSEKLDSLKAIFDAKSVAIIGASRPGTQGGVILKNCLGIKKLYPIHPKLEKIHGIKCYPSLKDLPEIPEVGVFAVNAERTVSIFEAFCKIGGKGAVIFSDGFAEVGRIDLEERLKELSLEYNVPYIGPNCMGVIDNFSKLNTNFIPELRSSAVHTANNIGIISQSGGIGLELLEMFSADNLDVGKWVSIGNASCVGVPELLAHMGEDTNIDIIAIYLEGIADGLKLMEIGREVSQKKPVLVIKGGIGGGAEAAMSHTASLAGSHEAFKACCKQAGFFLVDELTEDPKILVNILSMLISQPKTEGDRIAVVSVGGGAGILLADQVTEEGMQLAQFAPETILRLRNLMKANLAPNKLENSEKILESIGHNPIDLFGDCGDDRLLETLRIIDEDPNSDVVIAAIYLQVPLLSEYLPERLLELKSELKKPLIFSPRGFSDYVNRCRSYLYSRKFPSYTVPMIKPLSFVLKIWDRYNVSFYKGK
ncbi:MAG: CoA-binding protein [Deltaproteobacteria bacterium]|jgi:acyl-CoA synthetase (NDP forming)|nr:CoA-binding protein [Deltaproteobacteria bacterium]